MSIFLFYSDRSENEELNSRAIEMSEILHKHCIKWGLVCTNYDQSENERLHRANIYDLYEWDGFKMSETWQVWNSETPWTESKLNALPWRSILFCAVAYLEYRNWWGLEGVPSCIMFIRPANTFLQKKKLLRNPKNLDIASSKNLEVCSWILNNVLKCKK